MKIFERRRCMRYCTIPPHARIGACISTTFSPSAQRHPSCSRKPR